MFCTPIYRLLKTIVFSIILASASLAVAQPTVDSLRRTLSSADTPTDSIDILYNILDLTLYGHQAETLEQLYDLARRSDNVAVMGDVLRLEANYFSKNDSMQHLILQRAAALPEGPERQTTMLFAKVRNNAQLVRALPEDKRQARLRDYLARHSASTTMDTYDRIEYLFYLCAYLRSATDGDLLTKYLKELQELIDNLPARDMSLKSMFYTQAAISYLTNEMYDEAIVANKTLLDIIDQLQKQYAAKGRKYRSYDRSAYLCYRRLLRCYEALTQEEVDTYYNNILSIYQNEPALLADFNDRQRPTIYYLMAKQRYKEVIPIIITQLDDPEITPADKFYLTECLLKASQASGDHGAELTALRLHDSMLHDRIVAKAAERYKELQIIYEVDNLKEENDQLIVANRLHEAETHVKIMIAGVVCLVLMAALIIVLIIMNQRSRTLTKNLRRANDMLIKERDNLQQTQKDLIDARDKAKAADRFKSDFVNNMSHELRTPLSAVVEYSKLIADCVDDSNHAYIKRFAELVELNSDLLLTLVSDVLDLPSIEGAKLTINNMPTSLHEICEVSINSVQKHLKPDVSFIFENENDPDIIITTDAQRVEQVVIHLLSNAAKFTEKGTITFGYTVAPDRKSLTFVVADTGIGIPRGKEDIIFSRFEKIDSSTQGNGLGLYIGRLVASLLKGELTLDKSYRHGARFIFTIPIA